MDHGEYVAPVSDPCATTWPMIRAAIYCRLGRGRAGAAPGVGRQEEDCRAWCARRGWVVAKVYADDDAGVRSGKPRPAWQQLIRDAQAGMIDAVVGWHVDVLTRSPRELEDVVGLADKYGVELATVTGEIDLSDPAGRLVARMVGAAARYEAKQRAQRYKQQRRLAAQARLIAGWGTRAHSDTPTIASPWSSPKQPSSGNAPPERWPVTRLRVFAAISLDLALPPLVESGGCPPRCGSCWCRPGSAGGASGSCAAVARVCGQ